MKNYTANDIKKMLETKGGTVDSAVLSPLKLPELKTTNSELPKAKKTEKSIPTIADFGIAKKSSKAPVDSWAVDRIPVLKQEYKSIPVKKTKSVDEMTDAEVIKEYESIPNVSAMMRSGSRNASATARHRQSQYERKQELAGRYNDAKQSQIASQIESANLNNDDVVKRMISLDTDAGVIADYVDTLDTGISKDDIKRYYSNFMKEKKIADSAQSTKDSPVLTNIVAVGQNVFGGVKTSANSLWNFLTGETDPTKLDDTMTRQAKIVRNTTSEMITDALPGLPGKAANLAYGVGTSLADMGASALATAGNPLVLMGTSAYANTYTDAKDRGLTEEQAIATATTSAITEAAFEKVSLDGLKGVFNGTKQAQKSAIKEILKQSGREAGEEMATEVTNEIADRLINGELSNFVQRAEAYQKQGMSEQDAKRKAWGDVAGNVLYSGLAGGLSGGVTGSVATVGNRLMTKGNQDNGVTSDLQNVDALNASEVQETNVEQETTPANTENGIRVGKATYIKSPYNGNTPIKTKTQFERVEMSQEIYDDAVASINNAEIDRQLHGGKIKSVVQKVYEILFGENGEAFHIPVEGLMFEDAPYIVDVNKSSVGKLVSDGPISAEKMSVLSDIDNVLAKAEYLGSANYDNHNNKNSGVIRYDYFETPIRLNGEDYVVTFDVEVQKGTNRYRTHRVINEMNLAKATGEVENPTASEVHTNDVDTVQLTGASSGLLGSSTNSIPNSAKNVNATGESVNQRVRGYNETLIEKTDAPQEVKNEFIENPDIYTQLSNADTLSRANEILANNDLAAAIAQYHSLLYNKNPVAVPLGYNLSKKLAKEGRLDESVQIVREMSRALTESGQFSQAAAITMLNNDPEAAKRYLIREIDTMNQKGREKFGKKWTDFELTESELKRFNDIKAGDADAIKALYEDVYNRLRKQYPSTFTEKLMEYRRVAMLLNVRTNVRNVVSNALLFPVRWTSDRVSALGEGFYSLINPSYQRTQSLNPLRSKQSRKLASDAFETVRAELLGDNKYEDAKGAIRDRQVFSGSKFSRMFDTITKGALTKANRAMGKDVNPSLMETARNFTYYLLQKGDDAFVKKNFESRMASYLDAQKIKNLEDIPAEAYALATQEAFKATFKDDSALANVMSSFRQLFNKIPGHFVGEAIMPFTKTPANLAMRGLDYSPIGGVLAVKTFKNAKNNGDIAKGITQLGQAATGTAAIALGYALAEAGWLKGALSDDPDEAQFQKQQGELAYSVKTPFGYLTYDWAQPASIPLILGVTLYDSLNNDMDWTTGLKQGTVATVNSWLELSPLQNLSKIFGGYSSPAENVLDVLRYDLPLSFIPAQLGAVAKIMDTTQRSTYDKDNYWNNLVSQAKAKVPYLSNDLPATFNTWGQEVKRQDNTAEAIFANILNPGQFGNTSLTPLDSEVTRLYDVTDDNRVFPKKAARKIGDANLDNAEYSEYQKIVGQNSYELFAGLMDSVVYDKISDDTKVETIESLYNFANSLAKNEVADYEISQKYKKAYGVYQDKGLEGAAQYYGLKSYVSTLKTEDMTTNDAVMQALSDLPMSEDEKGYWYCNLRDGSLEKKAQYLKDAYGDKYAYQWYIIKEQVGESKKAQAIALLLSDFSAEDKKILSDVINMSDKALKIANMVNAK